LDEVGRLSADFNSMAEQLGARERALADEAARAEALLRANRRLVANVSHELRTPLATLRGYLEALEQAHGHHLPAHDLAVIQREARRLTELIDDLFTLARAEAQQLPLTIEAVDADALAVRLVDTLAPLARRERQIELVAALPADLPLVRADRTRLEQVLLNLVQNALRHTPPGGIIAIEGAADAGSTTVTLTVADTGVGIPAEDLPLVFERFYRSDSSRARETGGAGLGLALVEELVTAMGGCVTATSEPGRGSRFSVALPWAERPAVAGAAGMA
jgi:signal transduction histidine kinase